MKKRSPTSISTSLDVLDDATIRHGEGKEYLDTVEGTIYKSCF